jgi:CHAT domain-containing protein
LLRTIREAPGIVIEGNPEAGRPVPTADIREALEPTTVLVEYFQQGEMLIAAVVRREGVEIVPLAALPRVVTRSRMLRLQLSKFQLGSSYTGRFESALRQATLRHLQELYEDLLAPIEPVLKCQHLVFVPHGALHYIPFHALHSGSEFVIDKTTVSYSPSASLYALRRGRRANSSLHALVMGVHDDKTPWIPQEVKAVAAAVPNSILLLGDRSSENALRTLGPDSRLIHIATHGFFRADNPMFSWVRLGDSYLSLYDLYNLRLPVDLVTLSGCATGLNVVAAGDELLGLARGLLYAGAQSLLLSLWDVHDRSTADFMSSFYLHLNNPQATKASALRAAMMDVRHQYPHPFHWAPFLLIGSSA